MAAVTLKMVSRSNGWHGKKVMNCLIYVMKHLVHKARVIIRQGAMFVERYDSKLGHGNLFPT